jgi:TorA maturation chaperone TorD
MVPWEDGAKHDVAPVEVARARLYGLLARLLTQSPTDSELAQLVELPSDNSPIGSALSAVAAAARDADGEQVANEYDALFIGLTEGELRPYASYYLTGFLYEKPLADLRADMSRLGFTRNDGVSEPEDHIASILEIMECLIVGAIDKPAPLHEQQRFFDAHVAPWAETFFSDLETAKGAAFYQPVGSLGRHFIAIEKEAFSVAGEEPSR